MEHRRSSNTTRKTLYKILNEPNFSMYPGNKAMSTSYNMGIQGKSLNNEYKQEFNNIKQNSFNQTLRKINIQTVNIDRCKNTLRSRKKSSSISKKILSKYMSSKKKSSHTNLNTDHEYLNDNSLDSLEGTSPVYLKSSYHIEEKKNKDINKEKVPAEKLNTLKKQPKKHMKIRLSENIQLPEVHHDSTIRLDRTPKKTVFKKTNSIANSCESQTKKTRTREKGTLIEDSHEEVTPNKVMSDEIMLALNGDDKLDKKMQEKGSSHENPNPRIEYRKSMRTKDIGLGPSQCNNEQKREEILDQIKSRLFDKRRLKHSVLAQNVFNKGQSQATQKYLRDKYDDLKLRILKNSMKGEASLKDAYANNNKIISMEQKKKEGSKINLPCMAIANAHKRFMDGRKDY
ncbi:unnamed protein product [Moneuplotes crassus]|uniref:Uncharacterized protein n=1 Tax=Euplotes crassus TaxID=5936 RepID=A0AAD2D9H3_EUPCR|nr:unnamed protein product [Moneuplotes crassus]